MSDYQAPPTATPPSSLPLWQIWGGMAIYGPMNFGLYAILGDAAGGPDGNYTLAAIFAASVVALAAGAAFGLRLRGYAAGILLGYVLMSLISGGVCTLLAQDQDLNGAGAGLFFYPLAIVFLAIVFAMIHLFKP